MLTPNNITQEREKTHGSFADNARISQAIKKILTNEPSWNEKSDVEREALSLICIKLARATSKVKPNPDDYLDIAGYASLVLESLK